jgi:hypothetical protein
LTHEPALNDDQVANTRIRRHNGANNRNRATFTIATANTSSSSYGIGSRHDAISGKNGVTMNHLVTVGFVLLLAALLVALDGSLALRAIDRLAQSEGYTDIQNVMTVANATIRF